MIFLVNLRIFHFYSSLDDSTFDLVLVNFDTDNYSSSDISNYLRKVDSKETLFLDHNMRTYKKPFSHYIKLFQRKFYFVKYQYSYLFILFVGLAMAFSVKYLNKKEENWDKFLKFK